MMPDKGSPGSDPGQWPDEVRWIVASACKLVASFPIPAERPAKPKVEELVADLDQDAMQQVYDETNDGGSTIDYRAQRESWFKTVCQAFKLDPKRLPPSPSIEDIRRGRQAIPDALLSNILQTLILTSLATPNPSEPVPSAGKPTEPQPTYSALVRTLILATARTLDVPPSLVYETEKLVAQQLYFILQRAQDDPSAAKELSKAGQTAVSDTKGKNSTWKLAATGLGFVLGGVAIGLTGGLAAPLVAGVLASVGIAGILTAPIAIGTLFGLAGGGLTAYRTQRRLKGIEQFEFEELMTDVDLPQVPSLHATIVCSGFLLKPDDYISPFRHFFQNLRDGRNVYTVKAETAGALSLVAVLVIELTKKDRTEMLAAGQALDTYIRDWVIKKGAIEVVKRTALAAFYTAFTAPLAVYKGVALAFDNQFQRAKVSEALSVARIKPIDVDNAQDKAIKAGYILADVLEKEVQGKRPVILIGSSLGALTVFTCLTQLHARKSPLLVFDAILISAPLSPSPAEWSAARASVARRLVNVRSSNDWVLAILARMHSLSFRVCGLQTVGVEGVEEIDASDILEGHLEISGKMGQLLERVEMKS